MSSVGYCNQPSPYYLPITYFMLITYLLIVILWFVSSVTFKPKEVSQEVMSTLITIKNTHILQI